MLEVAGGASDSPTEVPLEEPAAVALTQEEKKALRTLLVVELALVKRQIATNWGFILLGGTTSLLAGLYLIGLPLLGTEVALLTTICTLLGAGFSNLMSGLYAEQGYKLSGILVGATQMALGYFYAMEPAWLTAAIMTLGLCSVIATEGLYRVILALQNREVDGFWATLISGAVSIVGSALVVKCIGVSSLVVPGLALGLSLISGGVSRIVVSLYGRSYAKQAMEESSLQVVEAAVATTI